MNKKIRLLGPYAPSDRHADDITLQELVRLLVENEMLREQVKKMEDLMDGYSDEGLTFSDIGLSVKLGDE